MEVGDQAVHPLIFGNIQLHLILDPGLAFQVLIVVHTIHPLLLPKLLGTEEGITDVIHLLLCIQLMWYKKPF